MIRIKPSKCHADFRVTGHNLKPENVSLLLGLRPTVSWIANEAGEKNCSGISSDEGGWILSTRKHIISPAPENHILWLLDQMSESSKHFDELRKKNFLLRLTVQSYSSSNFLELRISNSTLVRLAEWKMSIYFDCWKKEEFLFEKSKRIR